jgi:hypothetical protein
VREGNGSTANNARYMLAMEGRPVSWMATTTRTRRPRSLQMQLMEKSSWDMATDINVDLSGKPPPSSRVGSLRGGPLGSFVGLPKEEGRQQGDEQSQIHGDDIQQKDPKEDQGQQLIFIDEETCIGCTQVSMLCLLYFFIPP